MSPSPATERGFCFWSSATCARARPRKTRCARFLQRGHSYPYPHPLKPRVGTIPAAAALWQRAGGMRWGTVAASACISTGGVGGGGSLGGGSLL
ncbi:hypothetical protein ebA756 [Aromatoleum aromaticum EbN1]|uniref:Uncharacterized protein n=1 Tax=Aromatoleum aromaticum (strain DSM 19018 / LMG 30748 / EbN1) TaxID=76114 RepID=Q5P852_AROAE|nr:hypothetical protein ebA756 [Aromatoleum aromaticum EbN1]